jgi:chromosome segregation ATPase
MQRIQELQQKVTEVEQTIRELEAEQSTDDVQKLLAVEQQLSVNRAVLARLQSTLRDAEMAQEAQDAAERKETAEKRMDEITGEYEQLSKQLRQEVQRLHSELYRTLRVQADIAPKLAGLRYEYQQVSGDYKNCPLVFSYPNDGKRAALVNLALSASDERLGLIWGVLSVPVRRHSDLVDSERRAYQSL